MSLQPAERWTGLLNELHEDKPPANMDALYVRPSRSCADSIVQEFLAQPAACPKFLLVGARGGGKSTELHAIGRKLNGRATLVGIDLDRSGVRAASVSAYDLLYISALALLQYVPETDREPLYGELAKRYADKQTKEEAKSELGNLSTALGGIATFATAAVAVATGTDLTSGVVPVVAELAKAGSSGLRLLSNPSGVVAETSPRGRQLQESCEQVALAVRKANKARPLCVLIDGLEKMNGEANERFEQVFSQTRLMADTRWAAVIAAPPCTLTETNSVDGRGFITKTVWGFGPDDLDALELLLKRRFIDAGFDPEREVEEQGLARIAKASGGLPRHAILIARNAVLRAHESNSLKLTNEHITQGIRAVAEVLGRGLTLEHLRILRVVYQKKKLPGEDRAATLFADGRILAYPPDGDIPLGRWAVHPLLRAAVEADLEQGS